MSIPVFVGDFRALPPTHTLSQDETLSWLTEAHTRAEMTISQGEATAFDDVGFRERTTRALAHFGCSPLYIDRRGVELIDCTHTVWSDMQIYKLAEQPMGVGMARRSQFHAEVSARSFEQLYQAGAEPPTDIVHVTCTGYTAPSAAQRLVARNGWLQSTRVTHAYHMGCYAALPALRIASGFVNAPPSLRPSGFPRADIVHTEICSLHLNPLLHTPEQFVIQSLFGDGVIAYSVTNSKSSRASFEVLALADWILPDSADDMQWLCSDWGMHMILGREVPMRLAAVLGQFIEQLSESAQLSRSELTEALYAIHPGGPKIIDQAQSFLHLQNGQIRHSREVLRTRGNMSSATLPHIWAELLDDTRVADGQIVVSAAFGPGLTLCGAIMRKLS